MNKKGWFIGASIFGMIVTGSAGVYAGSNLQEIKALLNMEIGIVVNNADFKPVDDEGNRLYPITYNDSTYLPVRAISEALKVPIDYDGTNNRVLIGGSGSGTATPPPAASFQRPKHLPSDFPLPADTKKIELLEDAVGTNKSVTFTLQTKESLKNLIKTYNDYLKARGYETIVDSSAGNTINISATQSRESTVIEGSIIDAEAGIAEYTITWSAV
ncbi:hypothetical protein [Paenibacillus sp. GYB003]|uniref:hypothetical protein n=1 Tax=Paenibacillus sp. GYB003 TaxID=2994392 RepID=UPI002F96D00D